MTPASTDQDGSSKMKVFGPGAYTVGNKGDAALVDVYLEWLETSLGTRDVTLTSFTPNPDAAYYGVPVLEMPIRPNRRLRQLFERGVSRAALPRWALRKWRLAFFTLVIALIDLWGRAYSLAPRLSLGMLPKTWRAVARAAKEADVCVAVPGGYLNAPTANSDWWLFHIPGLLLPNVMHKPLVLSPCSIGPFAEDHKAIASRVLKRADVLLLREETSVAICRDLGVAVERLRRTPDLGFRFARLEGELDRTWAQSVLPETAHDYLGVSVRYHTFPGARNPVRAREEYLRGVADSVAALAAHHGAAPVIVPQVLEDQPVSDQLEELLSARGVRAINLRRDFTPAQLCALYERFRLLIGTRMHANILAMSVGTPVVAIGYEPKTAGILSDMNLLDWFIDIGDVASSLQPLALERWATADSQRVVAKTRAQQQAKALDAAGVDLRSLVSSQ